VPGAGVLALTLRAGTDAEAVRFAVLPAAAVRAAIVEIKPASGRHATPDRRGGGRDAVRRTDASSATGLLGGDSRSAFRAGRHRQQTQLSITDR